MGHSVFVYICWFVPLSSFSFVLSPLPLPLPLLFLFSALSLSLSLPGVYFLFPSFLFFLSWSPFLSTFAYVVILSSVLLSFSSFLTHSLLFLLLSIINIHHYTFICTSISPSFPVFYSFGTNSQKLSKLLRFFKLNFPNWVVPENFALALTTFFLFFFVINLHHPSSILSQFTFPLPLLPLLPLSLITTLYVLGKALILSISFFLSQRSYILFSFFQSFPISTLRLSHSPPSFFSGSHKHNVKQTTGNPIFFQHTSNKQQKNLISSRHKPFSNGKYLLLIEE